MKEITESDALKRLSALCAQREQCREELIEKMKRWGLAYDIVNRVVDRLEEEGFINEERYCHAFIADKYRFEKWGKRKIAQALQLKKIPAYLYNPLLAQVDEEEYLSILQKLLQQKRKSIHAETDFERNGKLIRFALSRGFEMDDIRRCIPVEEEIENALTAENIE